MTDQKKQDDTNFTPPRHWVGPEELTSDYWSEAHVREKRGQEFFEKPVEWLETTDKSPSSGMLRREFLTLMGASMAMAGFACARRPVNKIIPYVVKPEEIVPGVAEYYATTCTGCAANCGVVAKNREGRPIKLEGNPEHPLNRGALCARGQASLLSLYDPDRLRFPLVRSRQTGSRKESTWDVVDRALLPKISELRSKGGSVRLLTGGRGGPSTRRLTTEFLKSFRDAAEVGWDPLEPEEIWQASEAVFGIPSIPSYRFADAEVIVSLGADFLGTWLSPVEHSKDWSFRRKLDSARAQNAEMSKFICFESAFTITGANADERYPIRPGDELRIALALAHELIIVRKNSVEPQLLKDSRVQSLLQAYSVDAVSAETGIQQGPALVRQLAELLWSARGRCLIVAGSPHSRTADSLSLQILIHFLNSVLGNIGKTVDFSSANPVRGRRGFPEVRKLIEEMRAGKVDALLIHGSNPAYSLPADAGFVDALKKVPLVLVFSEQDDETARLADYVLAASHPLESWGDAQPKQELYSIQQPLISPMHSTLTFEEVLLKWMKGPSWHEYLRATWRESVHRKFAPGKSFDDFWENGLKNGFAGAGEAESSTKTMPRFRPISLSSVPVKLPAVPSLSLALYAKVSLEDGSGANNPWLQELPDPITAVTWDNYLNLAPDLARKLGVAENDVVEASVAGRSVRIPVHVQPGMHPSVVAGALGYGRRAAGKIGDGAGVDLFALAHAGSAGIQYSGMEVTLRKTGEVYQLASTQWHTLTENRPIINDITLAEFRKDPGIADHTDPHLRLKKVPTIWPLHEYKGQRWGMTIDLNSCTGCGACVIACQAENNVPVVGRDQVRNSRQMHWIRIDRYYSGAPAHPEVVFQPMLCQHCENAPCETVCPVLATVHNDEGLNLQVYNRCVGTRYCQNNCPYKVRRFNFFDHWKSYEGTMNLAWNPDVTVRNRGVMEKCTFCTQRIRGAREVTKKIPDGEVQTACQQTCPTRAILFGDINDLKSRVAKSRADARAFRVLEVQNTRPSISYLTKVRNKVPNNDHE
ncbi:MAG: hypothetical protein A2X94_17425 [Bdellovibrionales bacterium GWB1_55_8]|nr:MAG: hypothetical protein A2X94_17425 [Bdellovibrionales bacterium GWB1_55_8]